MNRNVLITGATSGIGRATAEAFAKQGDHLIITGRREALLKEVARELELTYKVRVHTFVLDARDRAKVAEVVPQMMEAVGSIDVLVNNAGLAQGLDKFQDSDLDDAERMIDTNVTGLIYMSRAILPYMVKENKGHVINLGSTAGIYAYAGAAVYCATKAAVKTLSDGIRIDTIDTDIKVTTIQPGIVETPFSEVRFHGDKERAKAVYQGVDALKPEDIADIIVYASNQPKHVQISDITIMANQQATGFTIARK